MRYILPIIFSFLALSAIGQVTVEDSIQVPVNSDGSQQYYALWYKTIGYPKAGVKYAFILYGHGAGESTPPLKNISNSSSAGGPAYYIEHSGWPDSFLNQKDGRYYQPMVFTIQAANTGWGPSASNFLYALNYLESHLPLDSSRFYWCGISAGAEGEAEYMYHLGVTPNHLPAFSVLASEAGDNPTGTNWGTIMAADKDTLGGWGDSANDIHGQFTVNLIHVLNAAAPNSGQYFNIVTGGHGPWPQFNPTSTFAWTIPGHVYTQNQYQEMLTFKNGASFTGPVANAGSNQTITLPTNSVTLDGTGSTGTITSYAWTQVSGPNTASLATPSAVTCGASGLIQGVYVFKLSVNSGASTSTVQITVNGAYLTCRPGHGNNYDMTAYVNSDTAFDFFFSSLNGVLMGGDTLTFYNTVAIPYWHYITLDTLRGNPACPTVVTYKTVPCWVLNPTGDTTTGHNGTIEVVHSSYIKIDGNKGVPGVYGFKIEGDPVYRYDLGAALQIVGMNTVGIEAQGVYVHNEGTMLWMKNDGDCSAADNYPNRGIDSPYIHDCRFVGSWNEGMYIGNTSPDNAPSGACAYDQRPITCADTTYFPVPPRIGNVRILHDIVDSTGRGGIQLAAASVGTSYIRGNTVLHNGMNGDDAQGTCISIGTYTHVVIDSNNVDSSYTWAIASLGGSGTNIPIQILNNTTNHSGYQQWYNLATTSRARYNPATEPFFTDTLPWPQSCFIDTKPTCNPIDSTVVWIKNNTFLICKRPSQQIIIQNDHSTLQLHGNNIICNNTTTGGGLSAIFIDPTASGFTYSTVCPAGNPCNCLITPIRYFVR